MTMNKYILKALKLEYFNNNNILVEIMKMKIMPRISTRIYFIIVVLTYYKPKYLIL
jgi:hypothetical protein